MDRFNEDEMIELGAASAETKGPPLPIQHDSVGSLPQTGLTND